MSLSAQQFEASHHSALHHHHDEICPTCEQIIPNDRLEQVKAARPSTSGNWRVSTP